MKLTQKRESCEIQIRDTEAGDRQIWTMEKEREVVRAKKERCRIENQKERDICRDKTNLGERDTDK